MMSRRLYTSAAVLDRALAPSTLPTPPRLDETGEEAWYDGEDAIVALREFEAEDGAPDLDLPLDIKSYRLGASRSCEVWVPDRGLSAVHCLLERRKKQILVHDEQSTHGIVHDGRKVDAVYLLPGDRFTARPVTFITLSHEMRRQRPLLVELLGSGFAPWSPDRLMIEATKGMGNLLITGETGCEHERLARAIHAMSIAGGRPIMECREIPLERNDQTELIRQAGKSTLILPLTDKMRAADPTFCSMLFAPGYHVRVIALAPTQALARRVLPRVAVDRMQHVWIRPIAARAEELPTLLDRLLVERGAPVRFAHLTEPNRERFVRHDWRGNWTDLRETADRLTSIARLSTWPDMPWRERATAIGIPKSTLVDWCNKLKLSEPLFTKDTM